MSAPILSPTQLSERWGADEFPSRRIRRWCERGVFPGAFQVGNRWAIPLAAVLRREGTGMDDADLKTA